MKPKAQIVPSLRKISYYTRIDENRKALEY